MNPWSIPEPTVTTKWGEDLGEEQKKALESGQSVLLLNPQGEPHSVLIKDYYGTIRERKIER